jgi:hypothetical protein
MHPPKPNQFGFARSTVSDFTEGGCWLLARALHKRTGWPVIALGVERDLEEAADERYWEHMAVRMPDGHLLDVTGSHDEQEFLRLWPCDWATRSLFPAEALGYPPLAFPTDLTPDYVAGRILHKLNAN